jgi:aminoglycoside/choline kinase family phosphotransferase
VQNITDKLSHLFYQWSGAKPETITPLPPSGSERHYWRLSKGNQAAIGAWNPVVEENEAFFSFTLCFHREGLHVPAIYGIDKAREVYLIEDLGEKSLFKMMESKPEDNLVPEDIISLYQKSLKELVRFQVVAGKSIDYQKGYPYATFDRRSMLWDLNYFKYYFLKLHVPFHEGRLEEDFDKLVDFLEKADTDYFMYRDFQSRNILIKDDQPYFIDYQGGRKGPLQYDVASLLFQVKANLPFNLREELLDFYISELSNLISVDKVDFKKHYYGFVLIRLLQVLGAYGFRGLIGKKAHFLSSIPYALKNLKWLLDHIDLPVQIPELKAALLSLTELGQYQPSDMSVSNDSLTVTLKSFSYKHGIPDDLSGNGGGFVFDCRALPNPGREERYRAYNGKDQVIIDYLKDDPEVIKFLLETEKIICQSIDNYLARGFKHLAVNFGCTGGQHRSVYCTETLAARLRERYPQVNLEVEHTMLKIEIRNL